MPPKRKKIITISSLAIIVILGVGFYFFRPTKTQSPSSQSSEDYGDVTIEADDQAQASAVVEVPATANDYYNAAKARLSEQDWNGAVTALTKAIELDKKNPDYYSKKSQAEYNLGKKNEAKSTLETGLAENPDSDLLKTRLDVLNKQWFGNQGN